MEITKEFKWEMGHRLVHHTGKCYNVHGHNYVAHVTIEGNLEKNGFVLDFGILKEIVKQWIDDNLDHAMMLNAEDPLCVKFDEMSYYLTTFGDQKRPLKLIQVPFEPTAETIALFLIGHIKKPLEERYPNVKLKRVKIWETDSSFAEVLVE